MNYISHLMDDDAMKEVVKKTGMGIESIEFSIAENLDCFEQTLKSYEQRLEHMAPASLTIHGPFLDLNPMAFDSLVQQATMTRYSQAYEAARRLGAKKIIFHAGYVPSVYFLEGWAERMAEFYNRFLEDKTVDIQVLMENVLDPYPEPLREVAEQVKHPAFGICLDVGHAHCYSKVPVGMVPEEKQSGAMRSAGEANVIGLEMAISTEKNAISEKCIDIYDCAGMGGQSSEGRNWISILEPYIRHLHLHDNAGDGDSHMAVGQGAIPWKAVQRLLDQGVEYTLECRSAEDVLESREYLYNI